MRHVLTTTALAAFAAALLAGCPNDDVDLCEEDPSRPDCARLDGSLDADMVDAGRDDGGPDAGRDAGDAAPSDGGPDGGACIEDCAGDTPHCDGATGECVACLASSHCTTAAAARCEGGACVGCTAEADCTGIAGLPACHSASGTCVECTGAADCGGATPACDNATNTCVECVTSTDCDGTTPVCDAGTNTCVACLAHADCTSPTAARCDTSTNTCEPCTDSAQCAGVAGDLEVCEAGTCVQCTAATETTECGANSCNPATHTCTSTGRTTVRRCGACVADSECQNADDRCVPMEFMGAAHGAYCLQDATAGCLERPYRIPTPSRASLSGAPAEPYCGIDESTTTCEAVLHLVDDADCAADAECGAASLMDGLCRVVNLAPDKCTYACSLSSQCPGGADCRSGYCGGP